MKNCNPKITTVKGVPILLPSSMTPQDIASMAITSPAQRKLIDDLEWAQRKIMGGSK